jgi:DNA repair exonuclease SbcCD ATPase subunit
MKLNFKTIEIVNFLSIGSVPFIFNFQKGLHAIVGKVVGQSTSNGVGKSTICEALVWCIYGKMLRGLNNDQIINSINESECNVKLWFSVDGVDYTIERGLKPTFVKLVNVDNPAAEDRSSKSQDQEQINKLLPIAFNTFKNIVAININYSKPFFSLPIGEKRSLFEDINNLGIYGKMLEVARHEYNESRSFLKISSAELKLITDSHKQNVRIYNDIQELKSNWQAEKDAKISKLNDNLDNLKNKLDKLLESSKQADYYSKLTSFKEVLSKIINSSYAFQATANANKTELVSIDRKINTIKKNPICASCGTPSDGEHVKIHIQELQDTKERLETENETIVEKVNKLETKKIEVQNTIKILEARISTQEGYDREIRKTTEDITDVEEDLAKEHAKTPNIKDSITDVQLAESESKLNKKITEVADYELNLKYNDFLKDVFGDKGIKTWVIKKIIPIINKQMNLYLSNFGATYTCHINSDLDEKFTSKRGEEYSYNNFSSGEQKRIDLAFMFSIIAISKSQNSIDCNVLFLDEVCDSSMCSDGIYALMSFLKNGLQKSYPELATYIITHKKEISEDNFNSIINLKKENNFTKLESIVACEQTIQT